MKNKPERHKESNVFRFKTFGDRINEIDLRRSALYHIKHKNEASVEDVEETEFYQTYCKWIVLNLTEEYTAFQKQIRSIVTLPQLIHKKDFVVDTLLEALEKASVLSLQPLLDFVVALARDLREEFYPYFQRFLQRLIALLNTKEPDQLEWTLICLAHLFKILKPFLKKDISIVFNSILPLLENRNPEHVTNFAAECFSFVARDIKDKEKFLAVILSGLRAHKNGVTGCGRLLLEVIRGVNGQFHSCADVYLRLYFDTLAKVKPNQRQLLNEVLTAMVTRLLQQIYPVNMQTFWDVCYQTLGKFLQDSAVVNDFAMQKLLSLMGVALETREGKFLTQSSQLVTALLKVIDTPDVTDECLHCTSEMVAVLLLSKNLTMSQLDASRISKKMLSTIQSPTMFESFVWNCVHYSQFEVLVLPEFLRYLDKHFGLVSLELLAKIVMVKSPLSGDGICLIETNLYPIRMRSENCLQKIEEIILNVDDDCTFDGSPRELLLALIVYPHIIGIDDEKVWRKINSLIKVCLNALRGDHLDASKSEGPEPESFRKRNMRLIFILSFLIESQIKLSKFANSGKKPNKQKISLQKLVTKLLPFCRCENYRYIHALRLLDLVVTFEANHQPNGEKSAEFTRDLFNEMHKSLSNNLASRYHAVRRLTAHLFDQFAVELKISEADQSIYSVFYAIESIEPTIQTYREQLLHFQKIEPSERFLASLTQKNELCRLDPLKYLLGCLYVNFSLLWKPVMELIATYFDELDIGEFWQLYKWKMDETTELQRSGLHDDVQDDLEFIDADSYLSSEYVRVWRNTERAADLVNYRILLWRMIPTLGMLREVKNREIVTIFLDFVEHEYKKSVDYDSFTWNIRKKGAVDESAVESDEIANVDAEVDDEDAEEKLIGEIAEKSTPKGTQRTLITMLQAFVNQANPKQLHREPELSALYMELLSHRNAAVQKLALDCIVAYKHKFVQPYKEHLYHMVDDAKFKEAITHFKIDKEAGGVQQEHRPHLMPIVMRILFSKMLIRVGGQKTTNQLRKSLVMRFLGGCQEDEILIMLSMSFWLFETDFKDDAREMCMNVIRKTDLTNVLSPRKLQSSLDLIDIIQGEFSGLMSDRFLRYILNLLLVIGSIAYSVLQQNELNSGKISSKMTATFKNLRSTCMLNLVRFFNHFDTYTWSDNEIDAMFLVFVSPLAHKLPQESVQTVSPLLKLFATFAKSPRLFVLLTRHTKTNDASIDEDSTPLKLLMDLLVEQKARPLVCLTIMEIIQNLLILSDESTLDATLTTPLLEISQCQPVDANRLKEVPNADALNFGSKILLPYLPKILQKFKMNLKKRRGLTKRDLLILSKITELITDAETCNTLLTVLLPILVRKSHSSAGEEALTQMVNTIINLFKKIDRPERHIRNIAPMFEQITAVGPRKLLCSLLRIICNRCDDNDKKKQLEQMVSVVKDLNAWDRRWVEQPDYEKRLGAYKRISELLAAGQIDINFGLLIIYHSFYFIKHDKDMALRDSASHHLKTLVPALIRKYQRVQPQELDYLIGTVILNLVRRTLRDRNVTVRNEGILLLGEMARECPDAHTVLFDLNALTCKADREIDFFDNVTHLQSLRHGRGLLRFCTVAKTLEKVPSPRTLTQFILPLASMYLANEKYAAKHGLVTSAIETIGAVCHLLPWHQYEFILKYYLKCMRYNSEYQKQMVRIVMQILDAFHFDLSKANIQPKDIPVVPIAETEESPANEDKITEEKGNAENPKPTNRDEGEEEIIIEESEDEKLDEELDELNRANDGDDNETDNLDVPAKKAKVLVYNQPIVLSHSIAKKLVQTIATGLIPTLNNSITALSTFESFHKLNKKKRRSERESEEILRVPIALAIVKLLQKLPAGMLEQNISGILIKVCMFLRSPLISVRMTTRDILKNIMLTIGAGHLEMLLSHMTSLLTRGFQVHVLTITVHSILDALKTSLKNDKIMDKCLQYVLDVCLRDIFGQTGEEKEISKIGKHTPEAKPHNKSFLTLSICAANITESCLLDLLIPFKDHLAKSQTKKIVIRVQECFQKIVAGLTVNKQIPIESMLMFIYGTVSESIPDLLPGTPRPVLSEKQKEQIKRARPDCFLIPEDPASDGRTGAVKKIVVTNVRANAHVLIEFGLELLQMTLKRGKLLRINYQPFIDPIVPILNDSLSSAHVRASTFALKCLSTMLHKEMTSAKLAELTPSIVEQIFCILHKYVAANTDMSSENFNLVQSSFKTIVNILRYVSSTTFDMNGDQLKTLLFYVEQYLNVNETTKQTISFSLLKVILSRRLVIRELNNVLMQVARLAIQSESEVARQESKGIIVNYLMDYPLGKKIEGFMEFFISNLGYEVQSGRESAINILHSIAKRFPPKYLTRKAALMFVAGGARLINDESTECRQQVADCLETLLTRIDSGQRDELFAIVLTLLNDDVKPSHREMGALLCTRFINAEKQKFEIRIEKVLPILISALALSRTGCTGSTGKFVRIAAACDSNGEESDDDMDNGVEDKQRAIDHQLIQVQNTIWKIFETYTSVVTDYPQYADELAYESQKLLAYEHVWVRLNALKALQLILQTIDVDEIHKALMKNKRSKASSNQLDYLYANPEEEIKSLTLDLCAQLLPDQTDAEVAEATTTILLFIANMLKNVPFGTESRKDNDAGDEDDAVAYEEDGAAVIDKCKVNLAWLLRRMRYVIHAEVAKAPHSIILRSAVFAWTEGLVELLPVELTQKMGYTILTPLVREMSEDDQNVDAKLRRIAIQVGDAIRAKIGDDEYNILRAQIQKKFMIKRAERKKVLAMEKVSDPVRAAKRMQGVKDRKKVAKRRNMDAIKGRIVPNKKRVKFNHTNDD